MTSCDCRVFIQQCSHGKILSSDVTAVSDSVSSSVIATQKHRCPMTPSSECVPDSECQVSLSGPFDSTQRGHTSIRKFFTLSFQLAGVHARSGCAIPSVSHGSFFQEQMSNPVRRMAWSCLLPFFPMRADCHWQKLFRDWSAWWLMSKPPYGKGAQIKACWFCQSGWSWITVSVEANAEASYF